MRNVAGDEDEIERAFAGDLVGDIDVAALCVLNVRDLHEHSLSPDGRLCNVAREWAGSERSGPEHPVLVRIRWNPRSWASAGLKIAWLMAMPLNPKLTELLDRDPYSGFP